MQTEVKTVFEKVSFDQFMKDWVNIFPEDNKDVEYVREVYDNIKLPQLNDPEDEESGYVFFSPERINFCTDTEQIIPTGIRLTNLQNNEVLLISSDNVLSKYKLVVENMVSVIDSNYNTANNDGHIIVKIINCSDNDLYLEDGDSFCKGNIVETCSYYDFIDNE